MNRPITAAWIAVALCLSLASPAAVKEEKQDPGYQAPVGKANADQRSVIARLEKITIKAPNLKAVSLGDALDHLNQKGIEGQAPAGGLINVVMRGGDSTKVSLPDQDTNYAAAIDSVCRQASYRWWIEIAGKQPVLHLSPRYAALAPGATDEQKAVIARLEKTPLKTEKRVEKPLSEALHLINMAGTQGASPGTGVINTIVRNKPAPAAEPIKEPKVTLPDQATTFADAVDLICWKTGYRWQIEIHEDLPLLVIEEK